MINTYNSPPTRSLSLFVSTAAFFAALSSPEMGYACARAHHWPGIEFTDYQDRIAAQQPDIRNCQRSDLGGATYPWARSEPREARPQCTPDTLYFWKPLAWTQALQARHHISESNTSWPRPGDRAFTSRYLWSTPLGTFGYGDSLVRVKLQPNVVFRGIRKNQRDCSLYSAEENAATIYVPLHTPQDQGVYISEYFICSELVIESWSVDAPQSWEEALREFAWIIRKPISAWLSYIPNGNLAFFQVSEPWFSLESSNEQWGSQRDSTLSLFPLVGDHSRDQWSYDAFLNKLHQLKARLGILNIRFRPIKSMWAEYPRWHDHFRSRFTTYYHQDAIAQGELTLLMGPEPEAHWHESSIIRDEGRGFLPRQ